jgi:phosphomannomutase
MNQAPTPTIRIADLMESSGVKFGTSGARGLVTDMTDLVCYAYTAGFLQYLAGEERLRPGERVAVAGDFRPSSGRIMAAAIQAIRDGGYTPVHCGRIPSPAIALYGMAEGIANLMVTGSHIPDNRNGIKFNTATGEILKNDEAGIRDQVVNLPEGLFDAEGRFRHTPELPPEDGDAHALYLRRYLDFYPADALAGLRIGLYGHSGVGRQATEEVLLGLGAQVDRLGYSEVFIPVDTEAIRPEDVELAAGWAASGRYDALVSFDGDGDRPLIGDENGHWLRGDVAGVLCARHLGAHCVATPVSSNTVVEKCGWFERVLRTRIGSPYVVEAMNTAMAEGCTGVVGYEANGGFLIADRIERGGRHLDPLPTRDAMIVAVALLVEARRRGVPVSTLTSDLPPRFTYSDRLKDFPTELSRRRIAELAADHEAIAATLGDHFGELKELDTTDGLRMTFANDEVVHFRPSGNAPELRCYNEAGSEQRAREINALCMRILASWRD